MGVTTDIGERIELVSLDRHFHGISIGLYRQQRAGGAELLVHTYSGIKGAAKRIDFLARTMAVYSGMAIVEGKEARLRFPCGARHHLASKRVFIEASKLSPVERAERPQMNIWDKRAKATVEACGVRQGVYELRSDSEDEKAARRCEAIAAGLVKLGEMNWVEGEAGRIAFGCGESHDELVGLLLGRAVNVRAVEREQEMAESRGRLAAPSAQK